MKDDTEAVLALLTLNAITRHPATRPQPKDEPIRLVGGMSDANKKRLWAARAKRKAKKKRAAKSRKLNRQRGK